MSDLVSHFFLFQDSALRPLQLVSMVFLATVTCVLSDWVQCFLSFYFFFLQVA